MNQYEDMSLVYDKLTQDQPYHSWFNTSALFKASMTLFEEDISYTFGCLTAPLISINILVSFVLSFFE